MNALPNLLACNPKGKQQALQYGVLPLLIHLLCSSPSPVTLVAAARTLAVLAAGDTELQGQITSAGGLHVLLDKLDSANTAAAAAPEAQAAAASAAAAAAIAAADAVAKAAAVEARAAEADAVATSAAAADDTSQAAERSSAIASNQHRDQKEQIIPGAAQRIFQAVSSPGNSSPVTFAGINAVSRHSSSSDCVDPDLAAAKQRLAFLQVQVACLEAVAALAHDNR
jgi:G3E family GTPase